MRPHVLTLAILASICGCHRSSEKPKPPPTVKAIAGESAVLPHVAAPPNDAAVVLTPKTLTVGALARRYLLVAPKTPSAGPRPLVLVIHGDGGTMTDFHEAWPFERASQNDAYLAYLDGRQASWDLETLTNNVDIAYAEAVINDVAKALPIDRGHVFAAGYSSGGFFANVLACHRPGLLRAIASHAGGAPFNQAQTFPNGYPKCAAGEGVAALVLHGDDDATVAPDSGRFDAEYWAYVNGCNDGEVETTGYPECRAYRGCPAGRAVALCKIPGLGHWLWTEGAVASWTFFLRQ